MSLVLSRRKGQAVCIGSDIRIVVTEVHRSSCKLAIMAPPELLVYRGEVVMGKRSENQPLESTAAVYDPTRPTCPNHGAGQCCTECPDHGATDGLGFPHPSERRGRVPLQRCLACGMLRAPDWWTHDIDRARFGCRSCYPVATPAR